MRAFEEQSFWGDILIGNSFKSAYKEWESSQIMSYLYQNSWSSDWYENYVYVFMAIDSSKYIPCFHKFEMRES